MTLRTRRFPAVFLSLGLAAALAYLCLGLGPRYQSTGTALLVFAAVASAAFAGLHLAVRPHLQPLVRSLPVPLLACLMPTCLVLGLSLIHI